LAADDAIQDELSVAADDYRRSTMATLRIAFLSSAVLEFFAALAVAIVAIYVGFSLLGFYQVGPAGELTLFSGLWLLMLAPEFFQPLRDFAQRYHEHAEAQAAASAWQKTLASPPVSSLETRLAAGVENLSFAYLGQQTPLFTGFNLTLGQRGLVAITGPSGTGKSTLLKLLAGLLPATQGQIYGPPSIYLAQHPWLVAGSIEKNLRLAHGHGNSDDFAQVLEQVGLWSRLAPHGGLACRIGERGEGLSGGEAQRLALARCLLSPPRLILLDEPTAMIDDESAQIVRDQLRKLADQGHLVVVATHDRALQRLADHQVTLS